MEPVQRAKYEENVARSLLCRVGDVLCPERHRCTGCAARHSIVCVPVPQHCDVMHAQYSCFGIVLRGTTKRTPLCKWSDGMMNDDHARRDAAYQ
jgi:hypothetical protein